MWAKFLLFPPFAGDKDIPEIIEERRPLVEAQEELRGS